MSGADRIGLVGAAIVVASGLVPLLPAGRLSPAGRRALVVLLLAAALVLPIPGGGTPATWIRGILGDLAPTTILLLALSLSRMASLPGRSLADLPRSVAIAAVVVELALVSSTLGLLPLDLHATGWSPGIPGVLVVAALFALAWWKDRVAATAMLVGLGLWLSDLGPSANLWDSLVDPVFGLIAGSALLRPGGKTRGSRPAGADGADSDSAADLRRDGAPPDSRPDGRSASPAPSRRVSLFRPAAAATERSRG